LLVEESLQFIRENSSQPFFLYLPFTIPHAELLVPEDSLDEYRDRFQETPHYDEKSGGRGHYATQLTPRAAFAAMITRMDRDVGKIFDLLKELGMEKNTIVFFSSDNGPHAEGGADPDFFRSSGPLRGIKRDLYEGGIRVPLLVRWPGSVAAGVECSFVGAFWDFFPTACDLAGIPVPADIDGISLLPSLQGKQQRSHEYLYWEFHERQSTEQAIRKGKWKAVRHHPAGPVEMYDLTLDISESENVAEKYPHIAEEMEELFLLARTPHEIWPLKP
jgi:arylsulfatase A-like enzyme